MACQEIKTWSFSKLLGAFLDLLLSFLLLCGLGFAFFASKFLGIFGWRLPCPCNGIFGVPYRGKCLQRLFIDYPIRRISSLQMSLKNTFPFNFIFTNDHGRQLSVTFFGDDRTDGSLETDGYTSCSSFSDDSRRSHNFAVRNPSSNRSYRGRGDVKGKEVMHQRPPRSGLRSRRKAVVLRNKSSSVLSAEPPRQQVANCHYRKSEFDHEIVEEGSAGIRLHDDREELYNSQDDLGFDGNDKNVIRILEQALEEEQAAGAALHLELEKERNAAASAADEAMAMIMRLQDEKALIAMEARQYHRMIEEKSAYDVEEMNILKEILVRKEREGHFLEKELEAYRQSMLLNNESLGGVRNDIVEIPVPSSTFSLASSEDPDSMMQCIGESIDRSGIMKNIKSSSNYEEYVEGPISTRAPVKELPSSNEDKAAKLLKPVDFQRKVSSDKIHPPGTMISMDEGKSILEREQILEGESRLYKLNSPHKHGLHEKTIVSIDEEHCQINNARQCQGIEMKADPNPCGTQIIFPCDGEDLNKCQNYPDQQLSKIETESSLYDVHVVDDKFILCKEEATEDSRAWLTDTDSDRFRMHGPPFDPSGVSRLDAATNQLSTSRAATGQDLRRSCSDLTDGSPTTHNTQRKSIPFDLRRNSMSAMDNERLKLDTEIRWLRERLRIVQVGRERLSFSVEHRDREKIQFQLLEDIAKQLQEIRQRTESGKAVRQACLPPLSSKVGSKKRRCRSASLALHNSS